MVFKSRLVTQVGSARRRTMNAQGIAYKQPGLRDGQAKVTDTASANTVNSPAAASADVNRKVSLMSNVPLVAAAAVGAIFLVYVLSNS